MDSALKFELEIKNQTANSLELLLLNGFYQDFESKTIFIRTYQICPQRLLKASRIEII